MGMPPWIFPEPRRRAGARWVGAERGRGAPPSPRTISFQFKTHKSLVCELGFFLSLSLLKKQLAKQRNRFACGKLEGKCDSQVGWKRVLQFLLGLEEPLRVSVRIFFSSSFFFFLFFFKKGENDFFFPKATTTQPCSSYFGNPSAISSVATELEDN